MSIPPEAYYNAFNLVPQIGPIRFKILKKGFPSMEQAWKSNFNDLVQAGLEEKIVQKIIESKKSIDVEKEWEKINKENVQIIIKDSEKYPSQLKEISSAPEILYLKGELLPENFCIAIVGSRKVSEYGKVVAENFSKELSTLGITIVSGMAFGVDFIAQNECVKLKRRTIAVLGNGLDEKSIYPAANRKIARQIAEYGCIVSEYPIGTPPLRQNFPARNRIISGLSKGVLVVEASESSGSLITAKFALEQNRDIFAVPGSIYSENSKGTNSLIKMGAKLVTDVKDILEEYDFRVTGKNQGISKIVPETPEEEIIMKNLKEDEAIHIDSLSKLTKIKTAPLSSILTIMEMKNMVKNVGGMRYIKK